MAYAAVISLRHIIYGLLNSSRISLVPSTRESLESARVVAMYFQYAIGLYSNRNSKRLDLLDEQIRDVANELEDVLEYYEAKQLYSKLENYEDDGAHHTLSLDLEEVNQMLISFKQRLNEVEAYIKEFLYHIPEEEDEDDDDGGGGGDGDGSAYPDIDSDVEMVGWTSELTSLRNYLLKRMRPDDMCYLSYVGEVGTSKSVIGRTIFEDEQLCFDCCAWVTIGMRYEQLKEVVIHILDQVDNDKVGGLLLEEDEKMICE